MAEKRKNGIYRANFSYRDPKTGKQKRCRQSLRTRNKREAIGKEVLLRQQLENAPKEVDDQKKNKSFEEFAKHWLDTHATPFCKKTTLRSYKQIIRVHLVPRFGKMDMRSINKESVSMMVADLKRSKKTNKTINNVKGVLSSIISKAEEWNYCENNPALGVKNLRYQAPEMSFWEPEESERFLEKVKTLRPSWYAFFLCALNTGMRLGELVALQWGDVNFMKGEILVRQSHSHGYLSSTKSGKSRRIAMTNRLKQALRNHRHLNGTLVFPWNNGEYLTDNRIKHPFWTCIKHAGVPLIRFHDLRHTFASQLVMKGISLSVVQKLLGHSTISMTMKYAHLSPQSLCDAVAVLEHSPAPFLPHLAKKRS